MNARNDVKRPSDQSLDARLVLVAAQLRFAARVDFLVARWPVGPRSELRRCPRLPAIPKLAIDGVADTGVLANLCCCRDSIGA